LKYSSGDSSVRGAGLGESSGKDAATCVAVSETSFRASEASSLSGGICIVHYFTWLNNENAITCATARVAPAYALPGPRRLGLSLQAAVEVNPEMLQAHNKDRNLSRHPGAQ